MFQLAIFQCVSTRLKLRRNIWEKSETWLKLGTSGAFKTRFSAPKKAEFILCQWIVHHCSIEISFLDSIGNPPTSG